MLQPSLLHYKGGEISRRPLLKILFNEVRAAKLGKDFGIGNRFVRLGKFAVGGIFAAFRATVGNHFLLEGNELVVIEFMYCHGWLLLGGLGG